MTDTLSTATSVETETCLIARIISTIESTNTLGLLHDKWSSIARALGTPSAKIIQIRADLLHSKIFLADALHEIIEGGHGRFGSDAMLDKLILAFEDYDLNSIGVALRIEFNLPCKDFDNPSLSWDDIDRKFQGKVESSLKSFYPFITFDNESKSKFPRDVLVDLMTEREPSPFMSIIHDALSYYVPRTLIPQTALTDKLFERPSDTFLFTGIERHALSSKSGYQRTDTTSNQLDHRDPEVKFMVLDLPSHFSKFQPSTGSSVHHVKFEGDKFYWVKSIGPLDNLRRFIDKSQIPLSEKEFVKLICSPSVSHLPVCISDSPGMGKSEILRQIARLIPHELPERIIIFQEFPHFIHEIKRLNKGDKDLKSCIRTALQELTCQNELGRRILSSKLESGTATIELLLDGYDELSASSVQMANNIVKEIHSSLKSIRLWVTTRPHLLKNLENMLSVLGYNIQSFTPKNQIDFLTSYWSRAQDLPITRLAEYATNCLKQLKSTLGSKEEDIAGIPLQCLMIGEVYEEEATDYSQSGREFSRIKIRITSITDLYELTIKKKLQKYESTYGKQKLENKEVINMHIQLALKLIFPNYFKTIESKFKIVDKEAVLNVGILEAKGSEHKFIHRTFAEYFVALFVVNVLSGKYAQSMTGDDNNDNINDSLTELRLSEALECKQKLASDGFKYPVICFFINSLLSGMEAHTDATISRAFADMFDGDSAIKKLAWACVNSDFLNIFNLFDRFDAFKKHQKGIFNEELALKAIEKASVGLIKKVLDGYERFYTFGIEFQKEAIRAAVERGEFAPVDFLLNDKNIRAMLRNVKECKMMEILHYCVENSKGNPDEIIRQKIEVVHLLVQINPLLLEGKNSEGNMPLLCKNVNIRLLIMLIELGSDVLATNNKNDTILHATYLTPEEYHLLLTSIKMKSLVKLMDLMKYIIINIDRTYCDSLSGLMKTMDPKEETLDVYKNAGANFNIPDGYSSYPLLEIAIKEGRNGTTLRKLIQCGSDFAWVGSDRRNMLHVASKYCNLDAIYVLCEYGVAINAFATGLGTPLHIGARHAKMSDCLELVKTIVECHGNANIQYMGETFLHELLYSHENITAAEFHSVAELLIQLNCSTIFEVKNKAGSSSLMVALASADVEENTLALLLEHGVNLSRSGTVARKVAGMSNKPKRREGWRPDDSPLVTISGGSLLHAACLQGNYKVVPFLHKIGLNVTGKDATSRTPLHYAASCAPTSNSTNHLKTIHVLIEHGADVYATIFGETFLHILLGRIINLQDIQLHELAEFLVKNGHMKLFDIRGKIGVTPLHLAVKMTHVQEQTIKFLTGSGVAINAVDDYGDSVLAYAIRADKTTAFLQNLISCGANQQHTNNNRQNLLHIAVKHHIVHVIEFIMKLGMDVNGADMNGDTPLHLCFEYNLTLERRSHRQITNLLLGNGACVSKWNRKGMSPFALAKQNVPYDEELIQLLATRFTEVVDKLDESQNAQLHRAVARKNFILVKELLEVGANVNLQNNKLQTALHITSSAEDKNGTLQTIQLLIDNNADPTMKDDKDQTFLHSLLETGTNLSPIHFHDLASYLIGKGHSKSLQVAGCNNGTTPIHLALLNLNVEGRTVKLLASHVNWNLADGHGRTPLFFLMCRKENAALLHHLVQLGADYGYLDNSGNNLLHVAAEYGNTEGMKYFLELNVNDTNSDGNTPLHIALLPGREDVSEILNILAEAGADANIRNNDGQTPFVLLLAQKKS